jgi:hypothetical protein
MGRYLRLLEEYAQKQAEKTCGKSPCAAREKGAYPAYPAFPATRLENSSLEPRFSYTSLKSKNINNLAKDTKSSEENHSAARPERAAPCGISGESGKRSLDEAFQDFRDCDQNKALNQRYVQAVADAETFLGVWGRQAEAFGWSAADLFRIDPIAPLARYDAMGLIWMLQGRPVVALTTEGAAIRMITGNILTYYRGH